MCFYAPTKGKYADPIPVPQSDIVWTDEDGKFIMPPEKHACQHSKHWEWGKGTRNGQKLYFPVNEMHFVKWKMTEDELKRAIDAFDMASLDMPSILICKDCASKMTETNDIKQISKQITTL